MACPFFVYCLDGSATLLLRGGSYSPIALELELVPGRDPYLLLCEPYPSSVPGASCTAMSFIVWLLDGRPYSENGAGDALCLWSMGELWPE